MNSEPRKRILLVAFCCDPHGTMEERNGWHRALIAAQKYEVAVFYHPKNPPIDLVEAVPSELRQNLQFFPIKLTGLWGNLIRREFGFYLAYRQWHRKAYHEAKLLHEDNCFHLTHLVTLCGYREPGYMWKLSVVNVWGPIGGSHHFPFQMLRIISLSNKVREVVRTIVNYWQLNYSPRIRQVAANSVVLAATNSSAYEIERGLRIKTQVDLETGIDYDIRPPRQLRKSDQPFRMLWAGRLRAWKGLPLLLSALAELPKSFDYKLRILGDGSSKSAWQSLARQKGIDDERIEWIAWPSYRDTIKHYDWADAFVFTSQRDTSGTGLVEALAAGCPLIAVNHQGAKDLLEQGCGLPVDNTSYQSAVTGFRDAIVAFAGDPELWLEKSRAATRLAHQLHWSKRAEWMLNVYDQAIDSPTSAITQPEPTEADSEKQPANLNGLYALIDQGVISFTNFATVLILARECNDTVFAAIALAGQFINYSRSALERIFSASYAAFIHRSDEKSRLTGSSLSLAAIFTAMVTAIAFCAALLHFEVSDSRTLALGILSQCLLLPVQMYRDHLRSICLSQLKVRATLILDFVICAIQLSLIGSLVYSGVKDSLSLSIAWAFSNALFILIWFGNPPVPHKLDKSRIRQDWRDTWSYSKWLVLGRCLGIASYLFVPWVLAILHGDRQLATFAKATNLVGLSILIVTGLNGYFQPLTVKMLHNQGLQAMKRAMKFSFGVVSSLLAGLCLLYSLAGYWIMNLVYDTTDQDQGTLITLLGLNVLGFSFAVVAGNGLAALKLSLASFWSELASFCLAALVAFPLIAWRGSIGAALTILVGSLTSTIVTLALLNRAMNRSELYSDDAKDAKKPEQVT